MTSAVEAAVEAADEVSQSIRIRILCVKYSLNPLKFSPTRETDTKILKFEIDPNTNFAKMPYATWLYLYNCKFLSFKN